MNKHIPIPIEKKKAVELFNLERNLSVSKPYLPASSVYLHWNLILNVYLTFLDGFAIYAFVVRDGYDLFIYLFIYYNLMVRKNLIMSMYKQTKP